MRLQSAIADLRTAIADLEAQARNPYPPVVMNTLMRNCASGYDGYHF
jgi:hypothetical protein